MPEKLLLINFDPAAGAQSRSSDGASFDVAFSEPMSLPKDSNPTVKVVSATVWYTFPNVTTSNNQLLIRYGTSLATASWSEHLIILPPGLYGLRELNDSIERELEQSNTTDLIGFNAVQFLPDNATGKAVLRLSLESVPTGGALALVADFSDIRSTIGTLLGFDANVRMIVQDVTNRDVFEGTSIAKLAPVSSLMLHCSAARGSIVNGQVGGDVIASIPLDATPGTQILYQPLHAPRAQICSDRRCRHSDLLWQTKMVWLWTPMGSIIRRRY